MSHAPALLAFALLAVPIATAACSGSPAAPGSPAAGGARLTIVAEPVVTLNRGESRTLAVEERDAAGSVVTRPPDAYTWASSAPGVVEAAVGGVLRAGFGHGYALVTAQAAGGLSGSAHVWVQPPPDVASAFRITLVMAPDVPANFRGALAEAVTAWESRIRDELPPATLDGLPDRCLHSMGEHAPPPQTGVERGVRIYVGVSTDVDPHTVAEAFGGPCLQRPLPQPTTVFGRIALNGLKPLEQITTPRLRYLALHEMGHALGLVGVIQGPQPPWFDITADAYRGPMGLEGYRREFGQSPAQITVRGGHWPFGGDVMGGQYLRISLPTIGALMDLGYPTGWYVAQ